MSILRFPSLTNSSREQLRQLAVAVIALADADLKIDVAVIQTQRLRQTAEINKADALEFLTGGETLALFCEMAGYDHHAVADHYRSTYGKDRDAA